MTRKHLLTLVLAVVFCLPMMADKVQTITINGQAVEKTVVSLTFEGDNVVLHFADQTTQSADMDGVVVVFSDAVLPTAINAMEVFELKQSVDGQLRIGNLAEGTQLDIYNAAGAHVMRATAAKGETRLNIEQLKSGVYVICAGNKAVKFVKR